MWVSQNKEISSCLHYESSFTKFRWSRIGGPWLGQVCVCVCVWIWIFYYAHSLTCTLLIIHISIQGLARQRVLGWQGWEPLQGRAWQRCYFWILHQKTKRRCVYCVCVYVCVRVRSLLRRAKTTQKRAAYFFPRRHEVLVGFEDVHQSLLDVFLLHAGQHGGRQEERQTPLLSVEGEIDFSMRSPLEEVFLPVFG